ncbi:MAG: choice-of-anchor D domain-containing protein [Bryobacterales bacterium]|nr:choice-of-anchor D domain-containing protein [Bryobacterales bacterium]
MTSRLLRWLLPALCLAAPLPAQFQIVVPQGDVERPVTTQFDFGTVATGDSRDVRFRARNLSSMPAQINLLSLGGAGFTLLDPPQLPHRVESGAYLDFTVRFQPSAQGLLSATLHLNNLSPILRGTGMAAPVLWLEQPEGGVVLTSGSVVDYGRVERGTVARRRLFLENQTRQQLTVERLAVSGEEYRLAVPVPLPLSLEAGQSIALDLLFEPRATGPRQGLLEVDLRRVALAATAVEPPLPRPVISMDPAAPASARQVKIGIQLAEVSRTGGTGRIVAEFTPEPQGFPPDPGIVFVSTGSASASFTVAEGDSAARFDGAGEIVLQSGTTAGRLAVRVELGAHREEQVLVIPPEPPGIDTLRASRNSSGLEVYLAAFDNTRSAGQLSFTFYDQAGTAVPPGAIRVDARSEFQRYFQTSEVGGAFALRAVFPVSGDASRITAVEVELSNSAGSRSRRAGF